MPMKSTPQPDVSFPPAHSRVILDDHPGTGFPTWVGLLGGGATAHGSVHFDGTGLQLISPDAAANAANGQAFGCSALSRDTRPPERYQRIYLSSVWSARIFRSVSSVFNYSKGFEFGLDTADGGDASLGGYGAGGFEPTPGNRTLAMVRCTMMDETTAVYEGGKWQIGDGTAASPRFRDLLDYQGNVIAPRTPGYERLQVGMNYGKVLRQHTELVLLLTPQVIAPTGGVFKLSTTSGTNTATYTGTTDPVPGGYVTGTAVPNDTFVNVVNTGTKTVTLSNNASATANTLAGATYQGVKVTARIEGLRHNGVGFGSLAVPTYDNSLSTNSRANELLSQQGVYGGYASPACSRDSGFQNGMNHYMQIDNRSGSPSKATFTNNRYRAVAF